MTRKIDSSLKTRIQSALVLGLAVLGFIYLGGIPFALLMALAAAIGVYEWGKMVLSGKQYRAILMLFGMLYIGLSVWMMIWLRNGSEYGLYNILTLLLIVWASDISAYFTGKAIGGPKLAPAISPKKTWSGFFGSSVGAGIVAAALACPWVLSKFGAATIGHMSWAGYAAMGFVLAMFGQVGDLFISVLKRRYGVKDTGNIIPGHGGVLDRIDALLLVALLFGTIVIFFI
jgi:phosphatidate cytidylyltransferase